MRLPGKLFAVMKGVFGAAYDQRYAHRAAQRQRGL